MSSLRRVCCNCGAGLFPVALGVLMLIAVILSYTIAVLHDDIDPLFPYISDTGALKPESNVFGMLLNIGAVLAFITVYLRYRLVNTLVRSSDRCVRRTNQIALVSGIITALGLSIIANFQAVGTVIVHWVGALSCFFVGILYGVLNTAISYRMYPMHTSLFSCRVRLCISIASMIELVIGVWCYIAASRKWQLNPGTNKFHWQPSDPGFDLHIVSAVSEWLLSASYIIYFTTYVREFNKMRVSIKVEPPIEQLDERTALTTH